MYMCIYYINIKKTTYFFLYVSFVHGGIVFTETGSIK
jgi:hypothetical protein